MLLVYLGALLVAAGILVMQVVFGHHGDASGADGGGGDHAAGDHDASLWTFIASVRFWAFALLAFGMGGALITLFGFAGTAFTLAVALACGISSGFFAVTVIRQLTKRSASSHATARDVVGRVGRVIVPPNESGRCKIRVEIKGSHIDYVAQATEPVAEGDSVLVEEGEEGGAAALLVSRAPRELAP